MLVVKTTIPLAAGVIAVIVSVSAGSGPVSLASTFMATGVFAPVDPASSTAFGGSLTVSMSDAVSVGKGLPFKSS